MANTALPTLSSKGWVNDIAEKVDMAIAHFFASDSLQSQLYKNDEIANLPAITARATNDMLRFQQDLRFALERYLSRYYDQATVQVQDDSQTNKGGSVTMTVYAEVTVGAATYVVSNLLTTVDGKFEKIQKINNTGQLS